MILFRLRNKEISPHLKLKERTSMINSLRKIKQQRIEEGNDSGFTLIELLIVIVVLGILAAVVVFSLSGVAGTSRQASCKSDGSSIQTALAAYTAAGGTSPSMAALNSTTINGQTYSFLASSAVSTNGYAFSINTATTPPQPQFTVGTSTAQIQWVRGGSACTNVS
jgi:general secretion pathway protein G